MSHNGHLNGRGPLPEPPAPRRVSAGVRIGMLVAGLAFVFVAVLVIETLTADKSAGRELLAAPSPLIPERVTGYEVGALPDLAAALERAMRDRGLDVTGVEAASLRSGSAEATIAAARFGAGVHTETTDFRAGVLEGAASGYGIDLSKAPFRYHVDSGIAFYETGTRAGRMTIWFFKDAFEQLFVPPALEGEAPGMLRAIVAAERQRVPSTGG